MGKNKHNKHSGFNAIHIGAVAKLALAGFLWRISAVHTDVLRRDLRYTLKP
ncbi:hypothetical protein CMUST_08195 [Corynebacterium mustelae]|uniref:Uncharacterized protein n=1 Tax=Corynebacterium mustelae TaxID=571915 RepID=A0A0G3H2B4_9CORY|nr:hypothetical protein CMUST_08195 [Corynebacterium mustelae]